MMPEADQSFGQISDLLGSIMTDSGQISNTEINGFNGGLNEDSMKIIEEATAIVEQNMKDKFPDLPTSKLESGRAEASMY